MAESINAKDEQQIKRVQRKIATAKRYGTTSLNLGSNDIRFLPPEIGELDLLESLNISHNDRLRKLPAELGKCSRLTHLDFRDVPLEFPPPEIVRQGTSAIVSFLRAALDSKTRQWVSKLLIVGEGGVGKTQLLRQIRGLGYDGNIPTTHGIEIHSCVLPHPTQAGISLKLNAWDFGGQQIYHATHQFFLTNRSLFLLAWNARTGYEQGRLRYWLETITALAPESPILLVATHADQREPEVPLGEFKRLFPRIADQVQISNYTNSGISELRDRVAELAVTLPLMGEEWPTKWLDAANELRSLPDKYVKPSLLASLMTKHDVHGEEVKVLSQWLHELGDILQYPNDEELKGITILQPQWVAEHIGRVLVHPPVVKNAGIFTHQDMGVLWEDLDDTMQQHFLRLMEKFDLSYRTLENREISLVVERLPLETPDYSEDWDAMRRGSISREIAMTFRMSAVPAGIPTWFIARQHRFTTHKHWRTGALFADPSGDQKALIRVDAHERVAELRVRGRHPHDFFALLRDGFELTLARFPGLKVRRLIPCPGHSGTACAHLFDYSNLMSAIDRPNPVMNIQCPIAFEDVSITELLFGIHWFTKDTVMGKIEEAQAEIRSEIQGTRAQLAQINSGLEVNVRFMQREFLKLYAREQRLAETQCPNVFSLTPVRRNRWAGVIGEEVLLQLYCQAPGLWHPTTRGGSYRFTLEHQWLRRMLPYLIILIKILKLAIPVADATIGIANAKYAERIEYETKLMDALVEALPSEFEGTIKAVREASVKPYQVEGASLRALRVMLETLDSSQFWGGLQPILTPEGHLLWLCDNHTHWYEI
jgi:internalin A